MRFFSGTGDPIAFGVRTRCTGAALLMDATAMPTTQSFERWRDGELLDSANSPTQAVYLAPHRCRQGDKIAMGSSLAGRLSVAIRSVRGRRGAYWSERLVMSALFFHAAIGRFAFVLRVDDPRYRHDGSQGLAGGTNLRARLPWTTAPAPAFGNADSLADVWKEANPPCTLGTLRPRRGPRTISLQRASQTPSSYHTQA